MTGLIELAERVEKATGPDRELDGSIWWATRSAEELEYIDRSGFIRQCIERDGSAGKALQQFYDSSDPTCLAIVAFRQSYTASLDAAMTLVPEGWWVQHLGHTLDGWRVRIETNGPPSISLPPHRLGIPAATPALALTAACLRAIASSNGEVGNV